MEASVLQSISEPGKQVALASSMGVSESTVSRIKNERLLESLLFLAHAGFKVVPVDCKCVDGVWFDFLVQSHRRVMEHAPHLIWESQ